MERWHKCAISILLMGLLTWVACCSKMLYSPNGNQMCNEIEALGEAYLRRGDAETYEEYYVRARPKIRECIRKSTDVARLAGLLSQCHERYMSLEHDRGASLVYDLSELRIVELLGDCKNDAAARELVHVLNDTSYNWDGERAEVLCEALVACGPPCLPYLERGTEGRLSGLKKQAIELIKKELR